MIASLNSYKCNVDVYDPIVEKKYISSELFGRFVKSPEEQKYDGIILAVKHDIFLEKGAKNLRKYGTTNHVFFDLKYCFDSSESNDRL